MARELKKIGTYSKNKVRKYTKVSLAFFIPYIILWMTSYDYSLFYIDVGSLNVSRGLIMGCLLTAGALLGVGNYYRWKSGLVGETKVANNIKMGLDDKYALFNDVILIDGSGKKRGNIDHIVVGPTGVFAIETKHTSNKIEYDGVNWDGIRGNPSSQAIGNAIRLRKILIDCHVFKTEIRDTNPYVKAILVFSHKNCKLNIPTDLKPKNCEVIHIKNRSDKQLTEFILGQTYKFSNDELRIIEEFINSRIKKEDLST
jgi:hypothetical protein